MVSKTQRQKDKKRRDQSLTPNEEMMKLAPTALMILLLHQVGGSITMSMKSLKKFAEIEKDMQAIIPQYDAEKQTLTITAPEYKLPPKLLGAKKKLII